MPRAEVEGKVGLHLAAAAAVVPRGSVTHCPEPSPLPAGISLDFEDGKCRRVTPGMLGVTPNAAHIPQATQGPPPPLFTGKPLLWLPPAPVTPRRSFAIARFPR